MHVAKDHQQEATMQPQSHFLRLPAELRNIIYSHLLISPPQKNLECTNSGVSADHNDVASTCRPQVASIRAVGGHGGGEDIYTAILRVNKLCYKEAAAVLYGNTQLVWRSVLSPPISQVAMPHAVRFQIAFSADRITHDLMECAVMIVGQKLPSVRVVSLHIDIDFTNGEGIDPVALRPLFDLDTERIAFVIDLHVTRAWDSDEMMKSVICHKEQDRVAAKAAEDEAFSMRGMLVGVMEQWAKEKGKKFKVLAG